MSLSGFACLHPILKKLSELRSFFIHILVSSNDMVDDGIMNESILFLSDRELLIITGRKD